MKQHLSLRNFFIFATLVTILSACAPEGSTATEYGFVYGIWHGICFPFALVGKLFGYHVGLYAANNSGFGYWAGFIIGLCLLGGGGNEGRRRRRW